MVWWIQKNIVTCFFIIVKIFNVFVKPCKPCIVLIVYVCCLLCFVYTKVGMFMLMKRLCKHTSNLLIKFLLVNAMACLIWFASFPWTVSSYLIVQLHYDNCGTYLLRNQSLDCEWISVCHLILCLIFSSCNIPLQDDED